MAGNQNPHRKVANRARSRRTKGMAMIEFALSMPILLLFFCGTADLGRLFFYSIEVANAAAAGAVYGAFTIANMSDTTGITNAAKNEAPQIPTMQVTTSQVCQDTHGEAVSCGNSGARKYVSVTATYTFQTLLAYPLIPGSVALSQTVMMRGV